MVNKPLRSVLRQARRAAGAGEGPTDRQLLDRFLTERDEAAFELLVWRHGPVVFGVCRRVCRHEQDAEDAFQATFLALARKAGSIRRGHALGPWLCRVACRASLKARKRGESLPLVEKENPLAAPDEEVQRRDLRALVDEEIDRLPEKYRTALVACYLEGNTHAEAAKLLGCPKGTVAVRVMRARERLRDRLARRGVTLGLGLPVLPELAPAHVPTKLTRLAADTATGQASGPVTALAEGVMKTLTYRKMQLTAVVLALVLLGGVGAFLGRAPAGGGGEEGRDAPGAGRRADPNLVKVPSPKAGILVAVGEKGRPLRVGDRIKEGQVLARLDDRLARIERDRARSRVAAAEAEVRSARASAEEAKVRHEEIAKLGKKNVVSEDEVRLAKLTYDRFAEEEKAKRAAVEEAKAGLELAEILLDMHIIRSPADGVVHALPKRKGEGVRELETVVVLRTEGKGRADKPGGAGRVQVDVPAERDGKLVCLGAEVKPGEEVPEGEVVTGELGRLAIKVGKDEKVSEGERLTFPGSEQVYRRWKEGDPFKPDALRVFKETRRFRRSFHRGDAVQEGQLLGVVNPALALAELAREVAKLNAAEAGRRASVKTMHEAQTRYEGMQASKAKFPGSISAEEFRMARLTWERYKEESRARAAAVKEAQFAVAKALHLLKMHEIHSPLTGQVRAIHKHRGEAVRALEPVLLVEGK